MEINVGREKIFIFVFGDLCVLNTVSLVVFVCIYRLFFFLSFFWDSLIVVACESKAIKCRRTT